MMKRLAAVLVVLLTHGSGPQTLMAAGQEAPRSDRFVHDGTGTPDAATVRRVAETLGVGKTVNVKTLTSQQVKGKIQSLDVRSFTVTHGTAFPLTIAYDEVVQLTGAGWSLEAKITMGVAAVGAAVGLGILWFVRANSE